jgi:hypothetical protein
MPWIQELYAFEVGRGKLGRDSDVAIWITFREQIETGECLPLNLGLVLAPTSCTLIFLSRTRSRLALANDSGPKPKKCRHDSNLKFVDKSRIEELLDYASPVAACVQHHGP